MMRLHKVAEVAHKPLELLEPLELLKLIQNGNNKKKQHHQIKI